MKSSARWSTTLLWCGVVAILGGSSTLVAAGSAPAIPDPCKLITATDLEQIVGRLKGTPRQGDIASGEVSCEYAPVKAPNWINISLHDGDLSYWKKRNGGQNPMSLPEFGKDAFVNADFEGSADLYARKGALILRVTLPKGPAAVDMAKAIARLALPRL
jgi:hypothetical protein